MMIINVDGPLNVESLKAAVQRFDRFVERWNKGNDQPALFIVPELKFLGRDLMKGGTMPWMVLYGPHSPSFWFVGSSGLIPILESEIEPKYRPPK